MSLKRQVETNRLIRMPYKQMYESCYRTTWVWCNHFRKFSTIFKDSHEIVWESNRWNETVIVPYPIEIERSLRQLSWISLISTCYENMKKDLANHISFICKENNLLRSEQEKLRKLEGYVAHATSLCQITLGRCWEYKQHMQHSWTSSRHMTECSIIAR